jgi:hypothetical protein
MNAIVAALIEQEGEDIRRVRPGYDEWHLARPGLVASFQRGRIDRFEACRAEVFRAVLASELPVFIEHQDPPREYDVPGDSVSQDHDTWRVPPGFAVDEAASAAWLALGGWVIYTAPDAIHDSWPDVFRLSPDVLVEWIRTRGIRAAVCSFHDDDEWRVIGSADMMGDD